MPTTGSGAPRVDTVEDERGRLVNAVGRGREVLVNSTPRLSSSLNTARSVFQSNPACSLTRCPKAAKCVVKRGRRATTSILPCQPL